MRYPEKKYGFSSLSLSLTLCLALYQAMPAYAQEAPPPATEVSEPKVSPDNAEESKAETKTDSKALAEDTEPANPNESATLKLETMRVIARTLKEEHQTKSKVISGFDSTAIDKNRILTLDDLSFQVPNFSGSVSVFNEFRLTLRGIGNMSRASTIGGDNGLNFYRDGVYYARSSAAFMGFFDLDRIEILHGPQGSAYGYNASAGSVNLISKRPTEEFEGYTKLSAGNYGHLRQELAFGGPATETLRYRLSLLNDRRDGYIENKGSGSDLDSLDTQAGRFQLWWLPSDDFDLRLSVHAFTDDSNDVQSIKNTAVPGGGVIAAAAPFNGAFFNDPHKVAQNGKHTRLLQYTGGSLEANKYMGDYTLTSITAYQRMDFSQKNDFDSTNATRNHGTSESESHQYTQEFRLHYDDGNKWAWTTGFFGYYEDVDQAIHFPVLFTPGAVPFNILGSGRLKNLSLAGFGEVTYKVNDEWSLTGGARYSYDERKLEDDTFSPQPVRDENVSDSYNMTTGRFVLNYTPEEHLRYFFSIANGYRAGGHNIATAPGDSAFDPEEVTTYELGLKSDWYDKKLLFNINYFYTNYTDIQTSNVVNTSVLVTNVGEAHIQGIETQLVASFIENWDFMFNGAFMDSQMEADTALDSLTNTQVDITGNEMWGTPQWSYTAAAQYTTAFGDLGTLRPRVEYAWTDTTYHSLLNRDFESQGPVGMWNAFLNLESQDKTWETSLYVKNITDEEVKTFTLSATGPAVGTYTNEWYAPPRTYGVSFTYRF